MCATVQRYLLLVLFALSYHIFPTKVTKGRGDKLPYLLLWCHMTPPVSGPPQEVGPHFCPVLPPVPFHFPLPLVNKQTKVKRNRSKLCSLTSKEVTFRPKQPWPWEH